MINLISFIVCVIICTVGDENLHCATIRSHCSSRRKLQLIVDVRSVSNFSFNYFNFTNCFMYSKLNFLLRAEKCQFWRVSVLAARVVESENKTLTFCNHLTGFKVSYLLGVRRTLIIVFFCFLIACRYCFHWSFACFLLILNNRRL